MKEEILTITDEWERMIYFMLVAIFTLLIVAFISSIPKAYEKNDLQNNTVVKIIDGDTFEYYNMDSNKMVKVRLLCVDTPEEEEKGYEEAKGYLRSLILYKQVTLNSSITNKDKYGRLLRYVYVNDWGEDLFVNKMILDNGYGNLSIIPPEECKEMNNSFVNNSTNITND
jgi:micrococcal nuclease